MARNSICCICTSVTGRILLSAIFIISGVNKVTNWDATADKMTAEGMVLVPLLLVGAIGFELVGGLAVLIGCWARFGATLLILFLIPTTLIFHDFWGYEGQQQQTQMIHFMKNLAIMGGLFLVLGSGKGPVCVDAKQTAQPSGSSADEPSN